MSFSRRITLTVLLTLITSSMSTVFNAPDGHSTVDTTEKPLSILPAMQGPHAVVLPARSALVHPVPTRLSLPAVGHAVGNIITQEKVLHQFQTIQANADISAVIEFAMSQIGDPYVWGGTGPNGWDCSGLMVGAFHQIGVSLPRTSRAQFTIGSPVAYGQWAPGDLLFFGSSASSIHHVVLYIGNGQIIHASTFGVPVKTDTVHGGGSDYFGARRVI